MRRIACNNVAALYLVKNEYWVIRYYNDTPARFKEFAVNEAGPNYTAVEYFEKMFGQATWVDTRGIK
jgi:hypothetical protein